MRLSPKFLLLLIFGLSAIASFGQPPPAKADDNAKPAATPKAEKTTPERLAFPEVAGWEKGDPYIYPIAGAGYSVNYDSPTSGRVTVYAYDNGLKKIPNELKGVVAEELEMAKGGILSAVRSGIYSNVKEGKTETIVLGGTNGKVSALRSAFTLTRGDSNMRSDIVLFPYKNQFIKLRITRPMATGKADDDSYAGLLTELDRFFSK